MALSSLEPLELFRAVCVPNGDTSDLLRFLKVNEAQDTVLSAVNESNSRGSTALHQAWHKLNTNHVKILMEHGANIFKRTTNGRYFPAHNALEWLHRGCRIIKVILIVDCRISHQHSHPTG